MGKLTRAAVAALAAARWIGAALALAVRVYIYLYIHVTAAAEGRAGRALTAFQREEEADLE